MKTSIWIEEGRTQFVLTPESSIDKKVVEELGHSNLKTYKGQFYACAGGWMRQGPTNSPESLIFVIDKEESK